MVSDVLIKHSLYLYGIINVSAQSFIHLGMNAVCICSRLCSQVMPFFSKLGFECPEGKGDADFLQDVTIEKGQQMFRKDQSRKHEYMTAPVCNSLLSQS